MQLSGHLGPEVTSITADSTRKGPRAMTDGTVLAPGGLAEQLTDTAGRNRQTDEWSPVAALENTVSRMQRDLEDLHTENQFLRTPRGTGACAPRTTGGTHDDKNTLV